VATSLDRERSLVLDLVAKFSHAGRQILRSANIGSGVFRERRHGCPLRSSLGSPGESLRRNAPA